MSHMSDLKQYQVVQLHPEKCTNPMFGGCLMVVDEIKSGGIQGYVQSLGEGGNKGGQAYYRATWNEMVKLNTDGTVPFTVT